MSELCPDINKIKRVCIKKDKHKVAKRIDPPRGRTWKTNALCKVRLNNIVVGRSAIEPADLDDWLKVDAVITSYKGPSIKGYE